MTDVLLSPIRLSELEVLIKNSVGQALRENKEIFNNEIKSDASEFAKKYISRQEFMQERNIKSNSTPWLMQQKGKLTPYRFGKEIFYLRSEVDGLIKKAR